MLKNKKLLILVIIIVAIVVAGIVTTWKYGFKYDLLYGNNTKIKVDLGFNFDKSKLEPIVKEIFGTYKIQTENLTKDVAVLTVETMSDEQKESLVEKINATYELELTADDFTISNNNSSIDFKTVINQYIWITIITALIIEVYLVIRFRKLGILKVLAISLTTIILSQALAISLIAITRVELGTIVMPILLLIFVLDWYIINSAFEQKLQK